MNARIEVAIDRKTELLKCKLSCYYFILTYCQIYDAASKDWIPFDLWGPQEEVLQSFLDNRLVVVLKARQLGLTWLALAYGLWLMLFHPISTIALFSRRDTESMYLLSEERLRGMYNRLPFWMRFDKPLVEAAHNWQLPNQSSAKAFPANGGDSYTFSLAIVDEADLAPDLGRLMASVAPTITDSGKMFLISRVDKSSPESEFKNIYRAAKAGKNGWAHIFLPWHVRPERTPEWYEEQKRDIISRTGSTDDLLEQYPATDTEALSPRTLDKRIPAQWVEACYQEMEPLELSALAGAPKLQSLRVYKLPEPDKTYRLGIDTAEGNPTSDDSAIVVTDVDTGEEVASLRGKLEPSIQASFADQLGRFYLDADILVERNNHGHAVIMWLQENSNLTLLKGEDDKVGWLSSRLGKTRLYDELADTFRNSNTLLHSFDIFTQLVGIDGATLQAPSGQMDDLADAYALAQVARRLSEKRENFIELEWWDACKEGTRELSRKEPAVIALSAMVDSDNPNYNPDCLAMLMVTRHPDRRQDVFVRYCGIWEVEPGQTVDVVTIENELRRLCKEFSIVEVCYNPKEVHDMCSRLRSEQVGNFKPFASGSRLQSDKQLQDMIAAKRIAHDGNPLLRRHLGNANIRKAGQDGFRIVKRAQGQNVGAAVALSMACSRVLYYNLG